MEEQEPDGMMPSQIGIGSGDSADVLTPDNRILTIVVPGNETEITFPDLIPYTLYSCYASANTSAGEGKFTDSLTARTDDKSGTANFAYIYNCASCMMCIQ